MEGKIFQLASLAGVLMSASHTFAAGETVLYRFQGGNDGQNPQFGVVRDPAGNLYGTTEYGGDGDCSLPNATGCGTVFRLSPAAEPGGAWTETVLYSFQGGLDGGAPGGLLIDQAGNLYGTTYSGGPNTCDVLYNCGTVFKLSPPSSGAGAAWTKTVLYNFQGGEDGFGPGASLVADGQGNLYGTTNWGGPAACPDCGTVFELSPASAGWVHTAIYNFQPFPATGSIGDGQVPFGVTFDGQGNLYGATKSGGYCQRFEGGFCFGTVFELSPPGSGTGTAWSESVLYRFVPTNGGPSSNVVVDQAGAIYGAAGNAVYQLVNGELHTLYSFKNTVLVAEGVILGPGSRLFGVAGGGTYGDGAIFELQPTQGGGSLTETTLYNFAGSPDGNLPNVPVLGSDGALYGTTWRGGTQGCQYYGSVGCGTLFRVVP